MNGRSSRVASGKNFCRIARKGYIPCVILPVILLEWMP
ncbi:hypothetical protein RLEG12_02980 (plasmid) [Rhizobium leguminosarum bv. trifolii CB782]|nr:hypothetical protein RLEG12_02980 [Rhizobium leguminosarum bv. trifolii CB782]